MLLDAYDLLDAETTKKARLRMFEGFGYLSARVPSRHNPALAALAREIATQNVRSVVVVGHAFGSTMARKYDLGFRRALNTSAKLKQLMAPYAAQLTQYPRFVVASVGDTAPRMGKTPAQDRRVAVIFRPRR